ncbi:phthiocerol/phthiodiolone dimycocerosyl transferase family protein [Acidisarcina polymorpha]|uniref:phthiocerol/phthiodiolone dimycocerosyl transferase family protein n=1 Tax=Acidisarcina polymorpha TaxID=2211140 RepID=UPI0013750FB5|nr:hypothetical protein [Acidisarcina polymorpha]
MNRVPHFTASDGFEIPLRIAAGGSTWEREVEHEMRTLFDPRMAPLARTVLIHEPERTFVILVAHHSIADGMSSVFMLRDLLTALGGGTLSTYPFPRSLDEILGVPVRTSTEPGVTFSYDLARTFVEAPVYVRSTVVGAELTEELRERTHREGVTIHAIICAAVAAAGREVDAVWRDNPLRIFSPVDIRRLVGLQDECMVAFSKANTILETNSMGDLWGTARVIKETLRPFKTQVGNAPVLAAISEAMAANLDVEQGAELNRAAFSEEVMVSNVGLLPYSPHFGNLKLKSLWAPVILRGHAPEQTIGVATVNGQIHFVHSSQNPIPGLLGGIQKQLSRAV